MGVNFRIIFDNSLNKSQEEINKEFRPLDCSNRGQVLLVPMIKCFTFDGKNYCAWCFPPRYFEIEENLKNWQWIKDYINKVRSFLGNGDVYLGNDSTSSHIPSDDLRGFFIPPKLSSKYLSP
ncbi:MAG: hypothetical protein ACTSRG_25865 [Candidatus Helarchaeota archaeon]